MTEAGREGGLFVSLRRLSRTLLGAIRTRLEILGTEVEEQSLHFAQILLLAAAAGVCVALAVVLAIAFVIVLFWDTHRLAALGSFFLLFAGLGALLFLVIRQRINDRPKLFSVTIAELDKDREQLNQNNRP